MFGDEVFFKGCPVCLQLCCCSLSNKGKVCKNIYHCYKKCKRLTLKAASTCHDNQHQMTYYYDEENDEDEYQPYKDRDSKMSHDSSQYHYTTRSRTNFNVYANDNVNEEMLDSHLPKSSSSSSSSSSSYSSYSPSSSCNGNDEKLTSSHFSLSRFNHTQAPAHAQDDSDEELRVFLEDARLFSASSSSVHTED
jgi:hypothetical protein